MLLLIEKNCRNREKLTTIRWKGGKRTILHSVQSSGSVTDRQSKNIKYLSVDFRSASSIFTGQSNYTSACWCFRPKGSPRRVIQLGLRI
jgi:hypothetical protein